MTSPPPQAEQLARARRPHAWRPTRRGVVNAVVFVAVGGTAHWALGAAFGPAHPRLADWGASLVGGAALLALEVLRLLWRAAAAPVPSTPGPARAAMPAASVPAAPVLPPRDAGAAS